MKADLREIVLDTETTGLRALQGDRVVEIGCVEIVNYMPTGVIFHKYFNPERDVPQEATRIHGLDNEFLSDKPFFSSEVDAFLSFIGDSPLVIHNASFDMAFINAELARCGFQALSSKRVVDTLLLARKKYPGAPASLDALCKRFNIDLSDRTLHGALLDARLLAEVYLELCGGRQPTLTISMETNGFQGSEEGENRAGEPKRVHRPPRIHKAREEELAAHEEWLEKIKNALWKV